MVTRAVADIKIIVRQVIDIALGYAGRDIYLFIARAGATCTSSGLSLAVGSDLDVFC